MIDTQNERLVGYARVSTNEQELGCKLTLSAHTASRKRICFATSCRGQGRSTRARRLQQIAPTGRHTCRLATRPTGTLDASSGEHD